MSESPGDPVDPVLNVLAMLARRPGVSDFTLGRSGGFAVREGRVWRREQVGEGMERMWDLIVLRLLGREPGNGPAGLSVATEFLGRRWRVTHTQSACGPELALRPLPERLATPQELRLPPDLPERFLGMSSGLFVVAGATGMGKSTTIASLVALRAARKGGKYVSLEDPIEFLHPQDTGAVFSQREVGRHVVSYADGLIEALHQSPDVIVVQEIRERAGAVAAVSAAMTGHLVVASVHAHAAHAVPQRLLGLLGGDSHEVAAWREVLAGTLQGVLVQQLHAGVESRLVPVFEYLACEDEGGRILAVERAIRDADWKGLRQAMEIGSRSGSLTFAASLRQRRDEGLIAPL